jgi:signal transduction histidine kinase
VSVAVAHRLRTVQVRTTAIAMATVVVVLAIGAFGLVRLFDREQLRQVDAGLERVTEFVRQAVAARAPLPAQATPDDLFQVVDDAGQVVAASERLRDQPALWLPSSGDRVRHPKTVDVPRVGSLRVEAMRFRGDWLVLGASLRSADDAVSSLRTALAVALPALAVALAVVLWLVVGRTLRPVRSTMEREERLVADVSHELRSPLAGIRALLETESKDPAEIALNRLDALAVLDRLDALTDGLLAVARQDPASVMASAPLLDLDDVVLRATDRGERRPAVDVDTSRVSAGQVRGDEADLERMVANLLSNAVRHAATTVWMSVGEADGRVELTVADDGPGIGVEDRERIYDRFTRLDDARSRDSGGSGLGLSIVRAVVDAHGGTITVGTSAAGGAEFVVVLPAGDATSTLA